MKICYITNARMPTEKAHGLQIMRMCEAFALLGHEVEVILPKKSSATVDEVLNYYEIKDEAEKNLKITFLQVPNTIKFGKIGFWFQSLWFGEAASMYIRKNHPDVVYARDPVILLNMILIHKNLVWEVHRGQIGWGARLLLKKVKVVSISWGLAHLYSKFTKKFIIAPDAVDVAEFAISDTKEECRKKLGLPREKKIALYTGHLYGWKGAQIFADAAQMFTNYEVGVFVGGTSYDLKAFTETNRNNPHIMILGHKHHSEIPYYMRAADVLVLPNSGKDTMSSLYTSPLKLFEYMASGTPIVASDLSSLREVLNEKTAVFFTPDDPKSLHDAVKHVFDHGFQTEAQKEVEHYTWDKRAHKIAEFIQP